MGKRRANGEGTIYSTIQKNKKEFNNTQMCEICANCIDRSKCNNRIGWDKCDKCKNCTKCLKYCDRFYCYQKSQGQVSINGERKSSGSGKTEKEVKEQKEEKVKQLNIKKMLKNGELTLSEAMREFENEKLKYKLIKPNSYNRNMNTIKTIENYPIANKKVYQITEDDLKELLSLLVEINTSQSVLEKVYDEIHQVTGSTGIFENVKRNTFVSNVEIEEVIAFTIEEEKQILNYINTHQKTLVNENKSNIDNITIKNLIKFSFASAMRIGEICSLDKDKNIDKKNKRTIVKTTITKDLDNKPIIGTSTKTGIKKKKAGQNDIRYVPFGILFDEEEVEKIIDEQSSHTTSSLLFCTKDGKLISHSSVNAIFKRICRAAGVKLDLEKGCHIHMTKHTGVTRMKENGMDIYAISKIVGTSVKVLTETYAHIFDDFVEREIKKSQKARKEANIQLSNENTSSCKIIPFSRYSIR